MKLLLVLFSILLFTAISNAQNYATTPNDVIAPAFTQPHPHVYPNYYGHYPRTYPRYYGHYNYPTYRTVSCNCYGTFWNGSQYLGRTHGYNLNQVAHHCANNAAYRGFAGYVYNNCF